MLELIGLKIYGIGVNEDQSALKFNTDAGSITYLTSAECCSETWFADITGVTYLLGGTVKSVEEVPTEVFDPVDQGRTRQDWDQVYGYKLTTDKGYADIVFRNSSNGYYGGGLYLYEKPDYECTWTSITDDWSA